MMNISLFFRSGSDTTLPQCLVPEGSPGPGKFPGVPGRCWDIVSFLLFLFVFAVVMGSRYTSSSFVSEHFSSFPRRKEIWFLLKTDDRQHSISGNTGQYALDGAAVDPQKVLQLHYREHPDRLDHRLVWQLLVI